jgi:AcrR family transcriptional regulator
MPRKIDRRIDRTRATLRDALIPLILELGYDSVTVQDITDRANVGRATFYLHYRDKDELLMECVDVIVADFLHQIQQQPVEDWIASDGATIRQVFEFAAGNADLFRIIMRGHGSLRTSHRLREIVADKTSQVVQAAVKKNGVQLNLPVEVISNFFAGSLLALINWWLEEERPYSANQMAEMFLKLVRFNRGNLLHFA